jgi:putative DNA primase/helicase
LLFDNLVNGAKVRSPVLCAFATAEVYGDRKLGSSDSTSMPNTLLVALTGNNLTPAGDLARRSLVCRLDADAESARGRQFKIADLPAHLLAYRGELLVAAITIIRAYAVAGQPEVTQPLESFERWSRIVRDPLVWLGMTDPVSTQEIETDDDHQTLVAAFAELAATFMGQEFTSKTIAALIGPQGADVRTALEAAGCGDASSAAKVGYWLRASRDNRAGRWKLVTRKNHHGIAIWQLKTD